MCFLILGRFLGSTSNAISPQVLEQSIYVVARPFCLDQSFGLQKNWRWTCVLPRQKRAFANYRDHRKFWLFSKHCAIVSYANHVARIIDQHFPEKSWQTTNRGYFPIRDYQRLEFVNKVLLEGEILPHYQNSRFFWTYANSNKMSGPWHVRINGLI